MSITKRTALQAAAWTAVAVVGLGAAGELANARPGTLPAAMLAQASGPTGATGAEAQGRAEGKGEVRAEGKAKGEGRRGPKGRHPRGHKGFGMKGRLLHGEATVRGRDDVVRVIVSQGGAITAASATSITVKSDDGFTSTWALTDDTNIRKGRQEADAGDLKVGDVVHVMGEKTTAGGVVTKVVHVRPTDAERAEHAERKADTEDAPA